MVTLSFVITGCGAKSATHSFRLIGFDARSISGKIKCIPVFNTL